MVAGDTLWIAGVSAVEARRFTGGGGIQEGLGGEGEMRLVWRARAAWELIPSRRDTWRGKRMDAVARIS